MGAGPGFHPVRRCPKTSEVAGIVTTMLFRLAIRRTFAPLVPLVALACTYLLVRSDWFWATSSTIGDRAGVLLHEWLIEWFLLGG